MKYNVYFFNRSNNSSEQIRLANEGRRRDGEEEKSSEEKEGSEEEETSEEKEGSEEKEEIASLFRFKLLREAVHCGPPFLFEREPRFFYS